MRWKRAVTVVGVHAEGEYGKVVTGGIVDVPGKTMFDKMRYLRDHDDGLRKFLLFEPRGPLSTAPTWCCLPPTPKPSSATSSWNPPSIRPCPAPTPSAR